MSSNGRSQAAGFVMSVVGGLYFCALFTLPLAMVADTVDLDEAAVRANRARIRALRGDGE